MQNYQSSVKEKFKIPCESHFIKVRNSNIHYIEAGVGDPIVFLHDIPTSSYLWRNVIPYLSSLGRCIAPDFVGMGKSDKPDIAYRVFDHIDYITDFIDALSLKNITFVVHGWGSVVGFDYAMKHEDRVKSLVCIEPQLEPISSKNMLSLAVEHLVNLFKKEGQPRELIVNSDYFMDNIFRNSFINRPSDASMAEYRLPFKTAKDRRVIWQYLHDLPIGQKPKDVVALIGEHFNWAKTATLPKLLLYAVPGYRMSIESIVSLKQNLLNLNVMDLGEAVNYPQESCPDRVGKFIAEWFKNL